VQHGKKRLLVAVCLLSVWHDLIKGQTKMQVELKDGTKVQMDAAVKSAIGIGNFDSNAAVFFTRQLEYVKARSIENLTRKLRFREVFPISNDGGAGASRITTNLFEKRGEARIINAAGDDLPRADIANDPVSVTVKSIGASYGYTLDEIQAASFAGVDLDYRRDMAFRTAIEEKLDNIAFLGDSVSGLNGLLSSGISTTTVVNGAGGNPEWSTKTPEEILFDINDLLGGIYEDTQGSCMPNKLLIPPNQWSLLMSTPRATGSDMSIGAWVAANSPFLTSVADIIAVPALAGAGAGGVDVMVGYELNPENIEFSIPVETETMPIQHRNLEFIINGRARTAGLIVYRPVTAAIGESI
jgi:hypothetical protein